MSMSNDSNVTSTLNYTAVVQSVRLHNHLALAAGSFLFFDHILTFGQELAYIWKRPKTASAWLFCLNRYFALFANISALVLVFQKITPESCKKSSFFRQSLLVINQVIVCALLTLRIYALYGRDIRALLLMLISAAVLLIISIWSLTNQHTSAQEVDPSIAGCHVAISEDTGIHIAASWEALFTYDTLLFVLTVSKTWRARHRHLLTRTSIPIITLVLRDGAIYFAVMALANLANILTFYIAGPLLKGCMSTFASGISVTMMSRLMLNLHETAALGIFSTNTDMTETHAIFTSRFATTPDDARQNDELELDVYADDPPPDAVDQSETNDLARCRGRTITV